MGMAYQLQWIQPSHPQRIETASLQRELQTELDRLEKIFSLYREDSTLSKWNRSRSTDWQETAPEIVELLEFAEELHRATEGAYDPTIAPLVRLWNINTLSNDWIPPTEDAVLKSQEHVGLDKLQWRRSPPALQKMDPWLELDLNSLVEGLALRNLASILQQRSIENYLLELGGEFTARGVDQDSRPWSVAIETPPSWVERSVEIPSRVYVVRLRDVSVSTSGTYRHRRRFEGREYSHIFDARTGSPIEIAAESITVVHEDPLTADGWGTALMLLPIERAIVSANERSLAICIATSKENEWAISESGLECFHSRSLSDSSPPRNAPPSSTFHFSSLLRWGLFAAILILLARKLLMRG